MIFSDALQSPPHFPPNVLLWYMQADIRFTSSLSFGGLLRDPTWTRRKVFFLLLTMNSLKDCSLYSDFPPPPSLAPKRVFSSDGLLGIPLWDLNVPYRAILFPVWWSPFFFRIFFLLPCDEPSFFSWPFSGRDRQEPLLSRVPDSRLMGLPSPGTGALLLSLELRNPQPSVSFYLSPLYLFLR